MENNNKVKLSPSDSLSIIQCSRLLCNTNRELGMLVDYPAIASGNSLSRMGGKSQFIKGAVLGGLAAVVRERTGLDLQVVLDAYVEAARARGITEIIGYYLPTAKNAMVRELFGSFGFTKTAEAENGDTTWKLGIEDYVPRCQVIKRREETTV